MCMQYLVAIGSAFLPQMHRQSFESTDRWMDKQTDGQSANYKRIVLLMDVGCNLYKNGVVETCSYFRCFVTVITELVA